MSVLPIIVLMSESSTREDRWRELLGGFDCSVITSAEMALSRSPLDIVVTDSPSQLDTTPFGTTTPQLYGVVGIGSQSAADVELGDQPTKRELQLACRLLFEIVQLRRELAANQQTQELLTELVERDSLTGLANRRAWDAELARRMERVDAENAHLCLALFDLDFFKDVNTNKGYAVADDVLRQVGNALEASVRSGDFVARFGGDEFGVLLPNMSTERAEAVVERIRGSIEPALARTGPVVVTATAGLAMRQQHHDAKSLFAAADASLRKGKASGRNQTVASM